MFKFDPPFTECYGDLQEFESFIAKNYAHLHLLADNLAWHYRTRGLRLFHHCYTAALYEGVVYVAIDADSNPVRNVLEAIPFEADIENYV